MQNENRQWNEKMHNIIKAKDENEKLNLICEKIFENRVEVINHIVNHHKTIGNTSLNNKKKKKEESKYICEFAGKCPLQMSCNSNAIF